MYIKAEGPQCLASGDSQGATEWGAQTRKAVSQESKSCSHFERPKIAMENGPLEDVFP